MELLQKSKQFSSEKGRILEQFISACVEDQLTDEEVDVLCGTYGLALRMQSRKELTAQAKNIDVNL